MKVSPERIARWLNPPTPSMPFGNRTPCQWMVVGAPSLFVTKMRTRSPSTASMTGPWTEPL
jgi:hypothetical protein